MSDTPNLDLIESDDMSELYRKLSGKCARRTPVCGKCGNEYSKEILESIHFCECGNPLYCMSEPANQDLGDIGFDTLTKSNGGPCIRHMNEKQYQDFKERHRGISMPLFSGRLGEVQRSMMDDRKYGSIKENAVLANIRLFELHQRLDQNEGSATAWFALSDLWGTFQDIVKKIQGLKGAEDKRSVAQRQKLMSKQAGILSEIGQLIRGGSNREQTWGDLLSVNDMVAKFKLQEASRRQTIGAMMSPEEMMEVIAMIVLAVEGAIDESVESLRVSGAFTPSIDSGEVATSIISKVKNNARLSFSDPEKLPIKKE